jgi:hypothetical protein
VSAKDQFENKIGARDGIIVRRRSYLIVSALHILHASFDILLIVSLRNKVKLRGVDMLFTSHKNSLCELCMR